MKKITCSILLSILITFFAISEEDFFRLSLGFSTGFPLYGSKTVNQTDYSIETEKRAIIGTFANINLNIIEQVTFFTGAEILADLNWSSSEYKHYLHAGFPLGIKIYPGLEGLNFGLAYELGFRSDFVKIKNGQRDNENKKWGNGFKVLVEYNFAHDSKLKYLPTAGCSWTFMPRGNYSYDNLIIFYIAANL